MLSDHLTSLPKNSNYSTLHLSFRNISQIDTLPADFSCKICHLYVNHNSLENLDGIEQFQNLQTLHIKYNKVENIKELLKIRNKAKLTDLNLAGNPILNTYNQDLKWILKKHFVNLKTYNSEDLSD